MTVTRSEGYTLWKQQFKEKLSSSLTEEETAVFLAILQGFAQAQQDLNKNVETVSGFVRAGKFSFWGETYQIQSAFLKAVDFTEKKWAALAREAMRGLHGQAGIHPASLRFAQPDEQAFAAQAMMETIRKTVLEKFS